MDTSAVFRHYLARILAWFPNKPWAKILAQWVEVQGQIKVAQIMQKHPHLWRSPQRTPNPKRKIFFINFN